MQSGMIFIDAGVKDRRTLVEEVPTAFMKFPGAFFHQNNAVDLVHLIEIKSFSGFRLQEGVPAHDNVGRIAVSSRKWKLVTDFLHFELSKLVS